MLYIRLDGPHWWLLVQRKKKPKLWWYQMAHTSLNIVSAGHLEVVKLLLGKGADPSLENETKQSVLWVKDVSNMI